MLGRKGGWERVTLYNTIDSQCSNPRVVIESIALHLCDAIEGFKEQLHSQLLPLKPDIRKKLDELNLNALFSVLIKEPLTAMQSSLTEKSRVVFIDALDEIEPSSRNEFITVLLSNLKKPAKRNKIYPHFSTFGTTYRSAPWDSLLILTQETVATLKILGCIGTKLARLLIDGETETVRLLI